MINPMTLSLLERISEKRIAGGWVSKIFWSTLWFYTFIVWFFFSLLIDLFLCIVSSVALLLTSLGVFLLVNLSKEQYHDQATSHHRRL